MARFRVTSPGLNVRTSPTAETDDNLFPPPLVQGDVVEQVSVSEDGKWSQIRIQNNGITREGWVARRHLTSVDTQPDDDEPSVEPAWMVIAAHEIGVRETENPDNPRIIEYLTTTTNLAPHHMQQDETDWCSAFVNWCMIQAGHVGTNHALARSWWNWAGGMRSGEARYGAIAVFRRLIDGIDTGKGHVGFFVRQEGNQIFVLGGNQSDAVNIKPRTASELIGYVHPFPLPTDGESTDEEDETPSEGEDTPFKRLPNGRLYEASLQERLDRIARLEARIADGEAESPSERAEIERRLDDARRDFAQAEARLRDRAPMPIPHATDAGPSPNWRAAWSWTTADRRGRYIVDPAAPFNDARIRNKPGEAQGANIERVVEFLNVENTARYKPQGDNTFCTVYVYDATWLLSAEIPIMPNRAANNMCGWLEGIEGQAQGWRRVSSVDEAQALANQGLVVIATQRRPVAGHVALVRPVPLDRQPMPGNAYTAQAGAVNSSLTNVADIFGDPAAVIFFAHA